MIIVGADDGSAKDCEKLVEVIGEVVTESRIR